MDIGGVADMVEGLALELANGALDQGWRHMAAQHGWEAVDYELGRGDLEYLSGKQDGDWQPELAMLKEEDAEGWEALVILVRVRVRQMLSEALAGGAR